MISFQTSRFGNIEVEEDKVVNFPNGLLGFADIKRYVLMDYKDTSLKWIQAVDNPDIAFLVVEPKTILPEYPIKLDAATKRCLQLKDDSDLAVLVIIRVDGDRVIPNIYGPLVMNSRLMIGAQVVLHSE